MVIDKEQLISLLTEKSGLEREQVERQLSELIDRIREAAEEGKKFEVEGFGTFSMQEGNLQFEPSDTLETEINNKYAGMKPIELIGAFKQPEGDEIPDIDEEAEDEERQVWAYDETASVEEEEPEEETEPTEEPAQEQIHAETEEQEGTAEEEGQHDTSDEDPDRIFEAIFGSSGKKEEATAEPQKTSSQPESSEATTEKEDSDEEEGDLIGRFLVAAVIIIAFGVGGWLVYDTGLIGGNNSADSRQQETTQQAGIPAQQTGDQQNETPQEAVGKTSQSNKTSEPEQSSKVAYNEGSKPDSETQQQETYGLRGDVEQSITNGYTIVVHSLTDFDRAKMQQDKLRQAGFRTLISTVEIGGQKRYRVGIGQFQSVEAAQQAVGEIPESFQNSSNHFIKRIQ